MRVSQSLLLGQIRTPADAAQIYLHRYKKYLRRIVISDTKKILCELNLSTLLNQLQCGAWLFTLRSLCAVNMDGDCMACLACRCV